MEFGEKDLLKRVENAAYEGARKGAREAGGITKGRGKVRDLFQPMINEMAPGYVLEVITE